MLSFATLVSRIDVKSEFRAVQQATRCPEVTRCKHVREIVLRKPLDKVCFCEVRWFLSVMGLSSFLEGKCMHRAVGFLRVLTVN